MTEIRKVVQKLSREQTFAAMYAPVQKHKVIPGIPGWLNDWEGSIEIFLFTECWFKFCEFSQWNLDLKCTCNGNKKRKIKDFPFLFPFFVSILNPNSSVETHKIASLNLYKKRHRKIMKTCQNDHVDRSWHAGIQFFKPYWDFSTSFEMKVSCVHPEQ